MESIKGTISKLTGNTGDYALPTGSLILVTGASGYIGSHVVNEALAAGYRVRGTARSQEKCDQTKKIFNNDPKYETAIVADFQHDGVFDEAVKGCKSIIHVASDTTFALDPNEVVTPTVNGTLSILKSAAKEPSVERFVLTSSSAAVLLPKPDQEFTVSENDWNEEALKLAWAPPPYTGERAYPVYAASKTEGEKALWKFMKDEKPSFVANAILPNYNMGRILPGGSKGATGGGVLNVLHGEVPPFPPQYMIDVVDDARLHLIAGALDKSLQDRRIFAFNQAFNWTIIINILKEIRPNVSTIPTPPENEQRDLSKVPNELGAELLKKWYGQTTGYKPIKQTIEENLQGQE